MFEFILFLFIYLCLFIGIDILQKRIFSKAIWARKATHISSSVLTFFLPDYFSSNEIYLLAIIFIVFLGITKWKKLLSLHNVKRQTYGELIYPFSVLAMAFIFLPNSELSFKVGILVLGFSDGLAGWIGEKINFGVVSLFNHKKSIGGSIVFFLSTVSIFIIFFGFEPNILLLIGASFVVTIVEFVVIYGFDNLAVPVITGFLVKWLELTSVF